MDSYGNNDSALSRRPWLELPGADRSRVCKLPGDRWQGGQPVPEAGAKKTSLRVSHQGNSIARTCTEVPQWKVGRLCSPEPGQTSEWNRRIHFIWFVAHTPRRRTQFTSLTSTQSEPQRALISCSFLRSCQPKSELFNLTLKKVLHSSSRRYKNMNGFHNSESTRWVRVIKILKHRSFYLSDNQDFLLSSLHESFVA